MMLRSSSTPILGSLLSSGSESSHHHYHVPESLTPNPSIKKLISVNNVGFQSFTKLSCNSSPNISPSVPGISFRRAQSEGNLEVLDADEFSLGVRRFDRKPRGLFLEPIPSFSLSGLKNHDEDEESEDCEEIEECEVVNEFSALGVAGDEQRIGTEENYRRMLEENPSNSLLLSNYARFLYQTKKDVNGAEEYYSRAILADPSDGEVLSQYAKLVWEVHRDAENATAYFERAVQAAAGNSHVEAAYASFLWEVEDDEEDEESSEVLMSTMIHEPA